MEDGGHSSRVSFWSGGSLTPQPPAELGEASRTGYLMVLRYPPTLASFSPPSSSCLLLDISFGVSSCRSRKLHWVPSQLHLCPSFAGLLAPDSVLICSCRPHCSKVVTHQARWSSPSSLHVPVDLRTITYITLSFLLSGDGRSSLSAAGADPFRSWCSQKPVFLTWGRTVTCRRGLSYHYPFMLKLTRVKSYFEPLLEISTSG